jgi:hypothetical protein
MPYIGKQPVVGNFVKLDAITTSATTTFNLLNGGTAYYPQTANNCIVSLNGVIQSPTSAYTISGSTIVFSDALTASDSIDFILVLGDVLSIGTPSDGTITSAKLASGTTGLIAWQSVQTTNFTASAGKAYPVNTTSAGITMTLPASATTGATIQVVDYAGTFATNVLTINPNGLKIQSQTGNIIVNKINEALTLTYIDSTSGWLVSSAANEGSSSIRLPYPVDFLVIAGGGAGGSNISSYNSGGGGGGAGGYRTSYSTSGGGASAESKLTFNLGTVYTITVGAGGSGRSANTALDGNVGTNSSISGTDLTTITSSGGGGGGKGNSTGTSILDGGSGGGGSSINSTAINGGSGTVNQGYAGGNGLGVPNYSGGGGGGAGAVGVNATSTRNGGNGGAGLASSITGSSITRAGGGGGGRYGSGTNGTGGTGGGGDAGANNGTTNTGSGGGGAYDNTASGAGGKGVVILRMLTSDYSGITTGSPTVSASGLDTILVFNDSGSYTG